MLRVFKREFVSNNLEHGERINPYIYLNHAYEVTKNQDIKPLLDYFKPNKKSVERMMFHVNNAKEANYLPDIVLEPHGFASFDELIQVIENALNSHKRNGLDRIENLRAYINDANVICEGMLDSFTQADYYDDYESVAPYLYTRRNVYKPLLFYFDFIQREDAIKRFRELFYALKYKQQFRDLLWVKVREPKIRAKYHPDNLIKILEGRDDLDIDELDELMQEW